MPDLRNAYTKFNVVYPSGDAFEVSLAPGYYLLRSLAEPNKVAPVLKLSAAAVIDHARGPITLAHAIESGVAKLRRIEVAPKLRPIEVAPLPFGDPIGVVGDVMVWMQDGSLAGLPPITEST